MSLDPVRCPDCRASLKRSHALAVCEGCGATYRENAGVLDLIGSKSELNASEVEVQDRVSAFYEDARYEKAASRKYHDHTLDVLTRLAPPSGTVLDDGCGNGILFEYVRQRGLVVDSLYGIDLSIGMLKYAKKRHESVRGANGEVLRADAQRLPFADATFDVVYARSLLHHLPDPAGGAREMARVLKPGGTLVALDPNRTFLSALPRLLARQGEHFDDDHKNFALSELVGLLGPDLSLEHIEFMGYLAYPLLGFPDLLDFGRVLPLDALAPALLRIDELLARVPVVKRLAWGVALVAKRR